MEILIGLISGIITGIGMGGGTILILLLTLFLNYNQRTAQATNLIFFVPTSVTSIIINIKEKNINMKVAIILTISGVVGAVIGAIISNKLEVNNLRKIFAIFLIIIAIHEIYNLYKQYIKRNKEA